MAYEISKLAEKFKSKGLEIAEEATMSAIDAISEWAEESAKEGTKPLFDGLILVLAPQVKEAAKGLADKIDGEPG
jgi:hypothetical protein